MKKGLLGLIVIALTVVGCQNYDDQFDELNDKILSLSQSISELDGIRTEVTALGTKLDQLASTSASASDLATVMAEVAALTASMAEIKAATDYGQEEVDDLEAEIDEIKAALNELLAQASIIQQDIVIMSTAQLEYVENLMGLDPAEDNTFVAEESREYIVSGNITVDAEFVEDAAIGTRLNNVLARIASVITPDDGSGVTIDSGSSATKGTALVMTSMAFVDGPVSLEGANAIDASALAALTATLTLKQGGDIAFPALNQTGDVRLAATTTITSLDLSNVTTGDVISTADGVLSDPSLAGAVNLGKLDLPPSVSLDAATSITAGGAPNGVVISALKATSINLIDTTPFAVTGNISITAEGAITLNAKSITGSLTITSTKGSIALNDLTTAGITSLSASTTIHAGITSNASGTVASGSEVHLAALASNAGGLTLTAGAVDLSSLATNASTATINTATALSLPALTSNSASITAAAVKTFSAEKLGTASLTSIDVADGADITVLNLSANASNTTPLADFGTLLTLTLLEQSNNVDFSDAASMTTLNYTGKKLYTSAMDQQTNKVTITNLLLTTLNIGDGFIGTLHVSGTGVEDLTTAGKIVNFEVQGNAALKTINFGHDHLPGERAATVLVSKNSLLTELNLSSIDKIKTVTITGNASLTDLTMAGYSPAAEPGAAINVTINGNALAASYKTAIAGSETTPYSDASLTDATGLLCSISDFINFYNDQTDRSATVSLSLNLAKVTNDAATPVTATLSDTLSGDTAAKAGIDGATGNTDDETDGGAIDKISEMKAIIDSCS